MHFDERIRLLSILPLVAMAFSACDPGPADVANGPDGAVAAGWEQAGELLKGRNGSAGEAEPPTAAPKSRPPEPGPARGCRCSAAR